MIGFDKSTGSSAFTVKLVDQTKWYADASAQGTEFDGKDIDRDNGGKSREKGRYLPSCVSCPADHEGRYLHNVVIVQHSASTVKEYIKAIHTRGHVFAVPDSCPHPDCQAVGLLIYWGFYERSAITEEAEYRIRIQRVRCKHCGRTHSLLPDFLHPHRHFALDWLRRVVSLYLLTGLGWRRLMRRLDGQGPARSTVREWVASFSYGTGHLLFDRLLRHLLALDPDAELPEQPPDHLDRVPNLLKRRRLEKAHTFWLLAERLYAQVKTHLPRLHFTARQFLAFLLHWLKDQGLSPRLFWSPRLHTTPTTPL